MIQKGYLEAVPWNKAKFYLPHSGVYKPDNLTTKLRIVFDGSAKSSNGRSLSQVQMTGPKLQQDICVILMKFRQSRYILSADIEKMFLQLQVKDSDSLFQCIVWKEENQPLQAYRFKVVVFGLSSSPFLAIRSLLQLATDEEKTHPIASKLIRENFYVQICKQILQANFACQFFMQKRSYGSRKATY